MPRVTVVIPLYNKRAEIGHTLGSVLRQSESDFAVIVVDDGSTDGGGDVVSGLRDPRIRLVRQDNAGVSAARNRGIALAQTELIALLDADDEWKPDFLRTVLALRERFPSAGLWCTGYALWHGASGRVEPPRLKHAPAQPEGGLIPDFFACLEKDCPVCSSNVLGRKAVFEEVGGFPVGVALGEDWDTWVRIAFKYPIAYTPEVQALYHQDASNRAMRRLTSSVEDSRLLRTLRQALRDGQVPEAFRGSVEHMLSEHLLLFAKHCVWNGEGAKARDLLREVAGYPTVHKPRRGLWLRSYLGRPLNRVFYHLRQIGARRRHARRARAVRAS